MVQRARIEYADQNEEFAPLLPRSGELVGKHRDIHGNSDWFLFRLDSPLDYQMKVGEQFQYRLVRFGHFLVRSRWAGHAVGAEQPAPVFILLVDDSMPVVDDPFDPASYLHVVWGTCVAEA